VDPEGLESKGWSGMSHELTTTLDLEQATLMRVGAALSEILLKTPVFSVSAASLW
jgi:hypothetical protein